MSEKETIATEAFCLTRRESGRSSAILNFYARELGLVSVYQRGFFGKTSKLASIIDLGQELKLVLAVHEEGYYLKEASLKRSVNLSGYTELVAASFVFELISSFTRDLKNDSGQIYILLSFLINRILERKGLFNSILFFQLKLLESAGLEGDMGLCQKCGRTIGESESSVLQSGEWNFFCTGCAQTKKTVLNLEEKKVLKIWGELPEIEGIYRHHLPKESVIKIQEHLNSIYSEYVYLNSLGAYMKMLE